MDILEDLRTTTFSNNEAFFKKAACEIEQLRTENAALKEQVAQFKSSVQHEADCVDSAAEEINRQAAENDKLKQTIAQQAEAIRLKDADIAWIQKRCAGEAMPNWENTPHTGHSRGLILDRTNHALAIQPSPEILQARDERVAKACANLVNRFISGDGILNDTWVHEIEDAIRSGEWRKYL